MASRPVLDITKYGHESTSRLPLAEITWTVTIPRTAGIPNRHTHIGSFTSVFPRSLKYEHLQVSVIQCEPNRVKNLKQSRLDYIYTPSDE